MSRVFEPGRPQAAFDWSERWPRGSTIKQLSLARAAGRVLALDLCAGADLPARASCARDGYALLAADTLGASDYSPLPLQLVPAATALRHGTAAVVANGDPLPRGADAVLPLEQGDLAGQVLEVAAGLPPGEGVIQPGEEYRRGAVLLPAGRRLRPQDLAYLAGAGISEVSVQRRPRVRILLAGRYQTDADGPQLAALVARDGGQADAVEHVADSAALSDALRQADAELILVAGGTGYAACDFAVAALRSCGEVALDGVAIHPGGGVVLGRVETTPVVLLPGTPLACLCAYDLIAARLLRRLAGRPAALPYRQRRLELARKLVSGIGRLELARVRIDGDTAIPLVTAEDRILASAIHADGFVLIPEQSEGFAAHSAVNVYLYDDYD